MEAEALVEAEPLRERRWAILALAQYRNARQADALRSIARARHRLRDEAGLSLGPELSALEVAILRQDPSLDVAPLFVSPSARAASFARSFRCRCIEPTAVRWSVDGANWLGRR